MPRTRSLWSNGFEKSNLSRFESRRRRLTGEFKSFRLDGKLAVITGGASGIGRAVALAAIPVSFMLSVTTYISTDISAIPLLWVLPLTLYLLSFIICFDHDRWYNRGVFAALLVIGMAVCCQMLLPRNMSHLEVEHPYICNPAGDQRPRQISR